MKPLFVIIFLLIANIASFANIDSLKIELEKNINKNNYEGVVKVAIELYEANKLIDLQQALEYAAQAFRTADTMNLEELICIPSKQLGDSYLELEKSFLALEYYYKAFWAQQKFGSNSDIAYSQLDIGKAYLGFGIADIAIEHFQNALQTFESVNNKEGIALCKEAIGNANGLVEYNNLAFSNYNDALKIWKNIDNKSKLAHIYKKLAALKFQEEEIELAISYADSAQALYKNLNQPLLLEEIGVFYGDVYAYQGDYKKAIEIYLLSQNYINNSLRRFELLNKLASMYLADNQIIKSKEILERILLECSNTVSKHKVNSLQLLAEVYEKENNLDSAYFYMSQYAKANEAIQSLEKTNHFMEMQVSLETQEKDRELKELKERNRFYIILVCMAIGLAFLLWYRNYEKRQANLLLQTKNNHINKQKRKLEVLLKELSTREMQLRLTNATKDKMFSIIGHDLRGPVGSIRSSIELLMEEGDFFDDEGKRQILEELYKTSKNTYNLLENLLFWAKSQQNEISVKRAKYRLITLLEMMVELFEGSAKSKNISLIMKDVADVNVLVDRNMISTVLRNLISNAIKFTRPKGSIIISAKETEESENNKNYITILISDNGVGISKEGQSKIFTNNHYSTYGTNSERGSGLGLILCKDFIEKNGGEIWLESSEGVGSTFFFTVERDK